MLSTVVPACSPSATEDPDVKIAFFQDLSVPDHVDLVSPSFLAFDMVVQRRLEGQGVKAEVVQFDTRGDAGAAIEMAEEVAAEGSFVLAVAAPFWHEPAEVAAHPRRGGSADDQPVTGQRLTLGRTHGACRGCRRTVAAPRARPDRRGLVAGRDRGPAFR